MDATATDIVETALRLLVGSGVVSIPVAVLAVLVLAALVVLAPRVGRKIGAAVKTAKPTPQPVVDEGGVQPEGVEPSAGEPGGGTTGGMG